MATKLPKSVNARVLAALLGVAQRSIERWAAEGLPRGKRGTFLLAESVRWYCTHREEVVKRKCGMGGDIARLTRAKADREEERVKILKGKHIERDIAERIMDRGLEEAKGILVNLPVLLAAVCSPEARVDVVERAEEIIQKVFKSLATGKAFPTATAEDE